MSEAARPAAPPRVFGVTAVGFASFNCVVGAGIFGLPGDVARLLGAAAVLGYLVCTLILALVALCLAECGSRVSSAGGMYAYAATAFGPVAGGVVGTMMWLTNVFASGAVANLWVDTLAQAWPALQQPALRIGLIAALYAVLMGVNVRSSRHGSRASSLLAAVKLVPLLVIIGAGVGHLHPATLHWTRAPSASALGEASALLFFAFIGVESGLQASGEVRDPARTIPRAVLLASSLIAVLYMALQLAAQGVLGDALASASAPLVDVAAAEFGSAGREFMLIAIVVSTLGYLVADLLVSPRALFALAEGGQLPRTLAAVHARFGTPYAAVAAHASLSFVLAVASSFHHLALLTSSTTLIAYLCCCLGVLRLRSRGIAQAGTPFVAPGGALVPLAAALLVTALLLALPREDLGTTALIIAVSGSAYAALARRRGTYQRATKARSMR